jgi:hypothetical protein
MGTTTRQSRISPRTTRCSRAGTAQRSELRPTSVAGERHAPPHIAGVGVAVASVVAVLVFAVSRHSAAAANSTKDGPRSRVRLASGPFDLPRSQ